MNKVIYLDNASTTAVSPEVILAMKPYWVENFGNPSSITKGGVIARQAVETARKTIAEYLNARPAEIVFTSGGTEANNLAIFGLINNLEKSGRKISSLHLITTNIEHSSVTECFKELESRGAKLDFLEVGPKGIVNPRDLRKLIKPNTVLVSVGYANNEIGVIQPIKEIAKEIRHTRKNNPNIYFHTDASQAGNYLNLSTNELGIDLMTIDAQKIYGPKGIGVLFVKTGVKISPIIFGGGQEKGLRAGTENVPLIVGLAKALEIARKNFIKKAQKIKIVRDYFWQKLQKDLPAQAGTPTIVLNGDLENRLPNNLNISIPGIDPEFTVLCLDEAGIVCSTKSACDRDADESFVVRALYSSGQGQSLSENIIKSALRFSLDENISKKDIDYTVSVFLQIIKKVL